MSSTKSNAERADLTARILATVQLLSLYRDKELSSYQREIKAMSMAKLREEADRLELARRQLFTGTAENLIKASGPKVLRHYLKEAGQTAFLRRVRHEDLALQGVALFKPITARVLELIDDGGEVDDDDLDSDKAGERYAETLQALWAVGASSCVQPPPRYFTDPSYTPDLWENVEDLPLWFTVPGQRCKEGQLPIYVPEGMKREDSYRGLSRLDLRELVKAAVQFGPGALISFRNLPAESLELLSRRKDNKRKAKSAAGD